MYNLYDSMQKADEDPEIVETSGQSFNEEDEEARIQAEKERAKEIVKWKAQMQENALMFLSDTDSIVKYRKRREIDNLLKDRMKIINQSHGLCKCFFLFIFIYKSKFYTYGT